MFGIIKYIITFFVNIFTHFVERNASMAGWIFGIFLARLWGPFLHQGMKTYRNEMSRFLPEVILHLRACNEMMVTLMEQSYNDHEDCSKISKHKKHVNRRHRNYCLSESEEEE